MLPNPQPMYRRPWWLGQEAPPAQPPAQPPAATTTVTSGPLTGVPGVFETLAVIAASAAATWVGIRTGMKEKDKLLKYAGWVGGVGSALLGLLYLGSKTGLSGPFPEVRVTMPKGA